MDKLQDGLECLINHGYEMIEKDGHYYLVIDRDKLLKDLKKDIENMEN